MPEVASSKEDNAISNGAGCHQRAPLLDFCYCQRGQNSNLGKCCLRVARSDAFCMATYPCSSVPRVLVLAATEYGGLRFAEMPRWSTAPLASCSTQQNLSERSPSPAPDYTQDTRGVRYDPTLSQRAQVDSSPFGFVMHCTICFQEQLEALAAARRKLLHVSGFCTSTQRSHTWICAEPFALELAHAECASAGLRRRVCQVEWTPTGAEHSRSFSRAPLSTFLLPLRDSRSPSNAAGRVPIRLSSRDCSPWRTNRQASSICASRVVALVVHLQQASSNTLAF